MKKILTFALCMAAVGSMSAQKAVVDQAQKLAGKSDKISEARALINQAIANPETANEARTYFVAGKVEFDAFDDGFKKLAINPNDASINKLDMGNQLINGYNFFLKALPLDSVPNEKGQVKPKFSKDIASRISGHHADFFTYGGEMYNNKHYYPEAYNAFMMYGDIPSYSWASKETKAVPDTTLALAYYYAGIAAYSGNHVADAVKALSKARAKGITDPQSYVYEIACWQNLSNNDSTLQDQAKKEIEKIATDGYKAFGIKQPLFINSLASAMVDDNRYDEALALVNNQLAQTADEPFLYALRAWVYDRQGNEEKALEDYMKGASYENADVETLNRAARKLYNQGTVVWNSIEGNQPEKRMDVKTNYWEKAKALLDRALAKDPGNPDSETILDSVKYALETYFAN